MESLLPSEIARLVYGYLKDEGCDEAANKFLETSENLKECQKSSSEGRRFSTRVLGGYNLVDMLQLLASVHSIVQDSVTNLPKAIVCGTLVEKLNYILNLNSQPKNNCSSSSAAHLDLTVPLEGFGELNAKMGSLQKQRCTSSTALASSSSQQVNEGDSETIQDYFNAINRVMFDNPQFHEKLAENINKVRTTPEKLPAQTVAKSVMKEKEIEVLMDELIFETANMYEQGSLKENVVTGSCNGTSEPLTKDGTRMKRTNSQERLLRSGSNRLLKENVMSIDDENAAAVQSILASQRSPSKVQDLSHIDNSPSSDLDQSFVSVNTSNPVNKEQDKSIIEKAMMDCINTSDGFESKTLDHEQSKLINSFSGNNNKNTCDTTLTKLDTVDGLPTVPNRKMDIMVRPSDIESGNKVLNPNPILINSLPTLTGNVIISSPVQYQSSINVNGTTQAVGSSLLTLMPSTMKMSTSSITVPSDPVLLVCQDNANIPPSPNSSISSHGHTSSIINGNSPSTPKMRLDKVIPSNSFLHFRARDKVVKSKLRKLCPKPPAHLSSFKVGKKEVLPNGLTIKVLGEVPEMLFQSKSTESAIAPGKVNDVETILKAVQAVNSDNKTTLGHGEISTEKEKTTDPNSTDPIKQSTVHNVGDNNEHDSDATEKSDFNLEISESNDERKDDGQKNKETSSKNYAIVNDCQNSAHEMNNSDNKGSKTSSSVKDKTPGARRIIRKKLSMSTPRRGSHIRSLDFTTPKKKIGLRRVKTSPKCNTTSPRTMRSLKKLRSGLFNSPSPKLKSKPASPKLLSKSPPRKLLLDGKDLLENLDEKEDNNFQEKNTNCDLVCFNIPIATKSPLKKLDGDWDAINGVGMIVGSQREIWENTEQKSIVSTTENPEQKNNESTPENIEQERKVSTPEKIEQKSKECTKEIIENKNKESAWDTNLRALVCESATDVKISKKEESTKKKRIYKKHLKITNKKLNVIDEEEEHDSSKDEKTNPEVNKMVDSSNKRVLRSKNARKNVSFSKFARKITKGKVQETDNRVHKSKDDVVSEKPSTSGCTSLPLFETPMKMDIPIVPQTPILDTPLLKTIRDDTKIIEADLLVTPSFRPTPAKLKSERKCVVQTLSPSKMILNKSSEKLKSRSAENSPKIKQETNKDNFLISKNSANKSLPAVKQSSRCINSPKRKVNKTPSKETNDLISSFLKQAEQQMFGSLSSSESEDDRVKENASNSLCSSDDENKTVVSPKKGNSRSNTSSDISKNSKESDKKSNIKNDTSSDISKNTKESNKKSKSRNNMSSDSSENSKESDRSSMDDSSIDLNINISPNKDTKITKDFSSDTLKSEDKNELEEKLSKNNPTLPKNNPTPVKTKKYVKTILLSTSVSASNKVTRGNNSFSTNELVRNERKVPFVNDGCVKSNIEPDMQVLKINKPGKSPISEEEIRKSLEEKRLRLLSKLKTPSSDGKTSGNSKETLKATTDTSPSVVEKQKNKLQHANGSCHTMNKRNRVHNKQPNDSTIIEDRREKEIADLEDDALLSPVETSTPYVSKTMKETKKEGNVRRHFPFKETYQSASKIQSPNKQMAESINKCDSRSNNVLPTSGNLISPKESLAHNSVVNAPSEKVFLPNNEFYLHIIHDENLTVPLRTVNIDKQVSLSMSILDYDSEGKSFETVFRALPLQTLYEHIPSIEEADQKQKSTKEHISKNVPHKKPSANGLNKRQEEDKFNLNECSVILKTSDRPESQGASCTPRIRMAKLQEKYKRNYNDSTKRHKDRNPRHKSSTRHSLTSRNRHRSSQEWHSSSSSPPKKDSYEKFKNTNYYHKARFGKSRHSSNSEERRNNSDDYIKMIDSHRSWRERYRESDRNKRRSRYRESSRAVGSGKTSKDKMKRCSPQNNKSRSPNKESTSPHRHKQGNDYFEVDVENHNSSCPGKSRGSRSRSRPVHKIKVIENGNLSTEKRLISSVRRSNTIKNDRPFSPEEGELLSDGTRKFEDGSEDDVLNSTSEPSQNSTQPDDFSQDSVPKKVQLGKRTAANERPSHVPEKKPRTDEAQKLLKNLDSEHLEQFLSVVHPEGRK